MFGGVAVADCYDITEGRSIRERMRVYYGRVEMYFFLTDPERVLPVYRGGATRLLPWGARAPGLPWQPWVLLADLDAGRLVALELEEVVIRASRMVDNGFWFDVAAGVRAVLVRDTQGIEVVYPLVERASHYYRKITGSEQAPCLVRQRI